MQYTENYRVIHSLNIEGVNTDNLFKEFKEVFPNRWIISFVSDKSMDYFLDNYGKCHFFRYYERNSNKTIIQNPKFEILLDNRKIEFPMTDKMIDKVLSEKIHIKNLPSEYHKAEAYEIILAKSSI